jgi:hypothetical protein
MQIKWMVLRLSHAGFPAFERSAHIAAACPQGNALARDQPRINT